MKVKTFQTEYRLIEFCYYLDAIDGVPVNVVDMIVDYNELKSLFALETDVNAHIFSGYEISECYLTDDNYIKVVCIKWINFHHWGRARSSSFLLYKTIFIDCFYYFIYRDILG